MLVWSDPEEVVVLSHSHLGLEVKERLGHLQVRCWFFLWFGLASLLLAESLEGGEELVESCTVRVAKGASTLIAANRDVLLQELLFSQDAEFPKLPEDASALQECGLDVLDQVLMCWLVWIVLQQSVRVWAWVVVIHLPPLWNVVFELPLHRICGFHEDQCIRLTAFEGLFASGMSRSPVLRPVRAILFAT